MFSLDFLLINSEIELIWKWTDDCILTEKATRAQLPPGAGVDAVPAINRPKDLKFSITDCSNFTDTTSKSALQISKNRNIN